MEDILKVENLSLYLSKTKILEDISLTINSGEIVAVIGPNGCGKSSLAYTIMGLKGYQPDQGEIYFKNKDLN